MTRLSCSAEEAKKPAKATGNIWAKEPRPGCAVQGLPSWPFGFVSVIGLWVLRGCLRTANATSRNNPNSAPKSLWFRGQKIVGSSERRVEIDSILCQLRRAPGQQSRSAEALRPPIVGALCANLAPYALNPKAEGPPQQASSSHEAPGLRGTPASKDLIPKRCLSALTYPFLLSKPQGVPCTPLDS